MVQAPSPVYLLARRRRRQPRRRGPRRDPVDDGPEGHHADDHDVGRREAPRRRHEVGTTAGDDADHGQGDHADHRRQGDDRHGDGPLTPPGPGAPPLDRTRSDAPWNSPEFGDRRRPAPSTGDRPTRPRRRRRHPARPDAAPGRPPRAGAPPPAPSDRTAARPGRDRTARRDPVVRARRPARPRPPRAPGPSGHRPGRPGGGPCRWRLCRRPGPGTAWSWSAAGPPAPVATPSVDHRKRLLVVLAVLATLFALLASKVVDLQVISPDRYLSFGEAQRTDTQIARRRAGRHPRPQRRRAGHLPPDPVGLRRPRAHRGPAPARPPQVAPLLGPRGRRRRRPR